MNATAGMIEVERQGDTLILTPRRDLRELDFQGIEQEGEEVLLLTADPSVHHVVVDFGRTDCLGSSALGLLVRLRHEVRSRRGRMALCRLSSHETDIFEATGFDGFWPVYPSRQEALEAVSGCVAAV